MCLELSYLISFCESVKLLPLGIDILKSIRNDCYKEVQHDNIHKEQVKNKDAICVNCLSEISLEKEIYISFFDHPNDEYTIIFELIDEDKKINGEDYRYYFAHRLS